MGNNKNRWNQLTMAQKAEVMKIATTNGVTDLNQIKNFYNSMDTTQIMNRVKNSKANFVHRLKDPNREYIKNPDGTISTHSMSSANVDGNTVVYPEVQQTDSGLKRFSMDNWEALDRAIENRDTLQFSNPLEAAWFSENYKKFFPKGKTFKDGGLLERLKEEFRGEEYKKKQSIPWYKREPASTRRIRRAYEKAGLYNSVDLTDSQTQDNIILGLGVAGMIPSPASPFLLGASAALGTAKGIHDVNKATKEGDSLEAKIEAGFTFPDLIRATGTSNVLNLLGPYGRIADKAVDVTGNLLVAPEIVKVNFPEVYEDLKKSSIDKQGKPKKK